MASWPTVMSRAALGIKWLFKGPGPKIIDPAQEVSDDQLNAIGWALTGLGVGVGGVLWELIRGTDGARLAGGECWNPNGDPTLSIVQATLWATGTGYGVGAQVVNAGLLFVCVTAGTSGGTGPRGTSNGQQDGSVVWNYVSAGGWVVRTGTGAYRCAFNATYADETSVAQPLTLQVAKAHPQTTSDLRAVAIVTAPNIIDIHVFNSASNPVDCNVLIEAR